MSKNTRNRILLTAVAALLLVVVAVGGTLAWLTDVTEEVTNTFTSADVHISLTETKNSDGTNNTTGAEWTAQLIPGKEYAKNPVVTVDDNLTNVNLWVFVKVDGLEAAKTYMTVDVADGWNPLSNFTGVYYREWNDDAETDSWQVLKATTNYTDGGVIIKSDLKADDLYNASATLKFTAYAIQKEGFTTTVDAWDAVKSLNTANDGNRDGTSDKGTAHATTENVAVENTPTPASGT